MKSTSSLCLMFFLNILSINMVFASNPDDYKCKNTQAEYTNVKVASYGLGLPNSADMPGWVTFCRDTAGKDCFAAQNAINDGQGIGTATLIILMNATALEKTVNFYCNASGWAQNVFVNQ